MECKSGQQASQFELVYFLTLLKSHHQKQTVHSNLYVKVLSYFIGLSEDDKNREQNFD